MPWLDLSGNLDFDLFGTVTPPFVTGPVGRALSFDGVDQYAKGSGVDGADANTLQGLWTFEAWIKWQDLGAPSIRNTLGYFADPLATGGASADNIQFLIQILPVNGLPTLQVVWERNAVWYYLDTGFIVEVDRWYHIAIRKIVVNADRGVDLFVNGVKVYTTQSGDEIQNCNGGSNSNWYIAGGAGITGLTFSEVTLGPLALYSGQLTDAEIGEDFQRGMGWVFDTVVHARVKVEDGNAAMVDVDSLDGGPWLLSAEWGADNDAPGDTAAIVLARESERFSLSPLVTTSKLNLIPRDHTGTFDPLLAITRKVEIWTARVPVNVAPLAGDWVLDFEGRISLVDPGGDNQVMLSCRDLNAPIMNAYIEEDLPYSVGASTPVETVMQQIIDAWVASPPTLKVPYTPAWIIKAFEQRREPTMTAIRTLAQQIGWDLRYKWDPSTQTFLLTLFDIDRDGKSNGGGYFTNDQYTSLPNFAIDESRIRNVVRVVFPSSEAADPGAPTVVDGLTGTASWWGQNEKGEPVGAWVQYEDAASIARYGRRFCELAEGETSQVDTLPEAERMAIGGVKDMAEPDVAAVVDYVGPFPEIELADVQTLEGDGVHTTAAQTLAVKSIRHSIGADGAGKSSASLRGKPALGVSRWLAIESRPGMGAPPLHVPTGTNAGKTTREKIAATTHGVDRSRAKSNPGKRVTNQNADFGVISRGPRFAPDHWTFTERTGVGDGGTVWGDEIDFETATADTLSGKRSVRFKDMTDPAHGPDELVSLPVDIDDGGIVDVAVTWKVDGGGTGAPLFVQVIFYDETETITGFVQFAPTMNTNLLRNGFSRFIKRGIQSVAGDRFVAIRLKRSSSNLGTSTDAIVDSAVVQQSAREFEVENPAPSAAIPAATWTLMRFSQENWDYADEFDNAVNFSLDAKIEGVRTLTVNAQITDGAASTVTGVAMRLRDTISGIVYGMASTVLDVDPTANFSYDLAVSANVFIPQDARVIAEVLAIGGATAVVAAGSKFSSRMLFEE